MPRSSLRRAGGGRLARTAAVALAAAAVAKYVPGDLQGFMVRHPSFQPNLTTLWTQVPRRHQI